MWCKSKKMFRVDLKILHRPHPPLKVVFSLAYEGDC